MKKFIFAVFTKDKYLGEIEIEAKTIEDAYDRAYEDAKKDITVEER